MSNMSGTTVGGFYRPRFPTMADFYSNLNLVPVTSTKVKGGGSYTTVVTKRKKGRYGRVSFQAKVRRTMEAKHYANSYPINLTHNVIYTCFPTRGIFQGNAANQREGDAIHLEAIKIKGQFNTAELAEGYRLRVIVGYSSEENAAANNETFPVSPGLSQNELFITNTAANGNINGVINPKACTVVYDNTWDVNSQVDNASTVCTHDIFISLQKKFPYQAYQSTFGKNTNLFITVIGDSTAQQGVVGQLIQSYDLIFKD